MRKCMLAALLVFILQSANSQTKNFIDQPYIEVNGHADTLVTPDEIYISIALSEKDSRDKVSIEELEERLVSTLKGLGIDTEKSLTTSDMLSNFKFYLLKGKNVIKTKSYELKVNDAITATNVFIKLEENGISNLSIARVDHSELVNLQNRMRTKAIMDAKKRATALTESLGQVAGPAIHISEQVTNVGHQLQGRVPGLVIRGAATPSYQDYDLPQIEFQKIRIASDVNVNFVLK